MRPIRETVSSATPSGIIPLDWRQSDFKVGLGVSLSSGAVMTYSVQHTFDDIFDSSVTPVWFNTEGLSQKTASTYGNYIIPVRACRLNVTSHTAGDATLTIIQAGNA